MGSLAWNISLAIVRSDIFMCDHSLGNFRLDISLGNIRLRSFALKHPLGNLRLGLLVWELSLAIIRLIYSAWNISIGGLRLGYVAWLETFRLGTFLCDSPLCNLRSECVARDRSFLQFRLRNPFDNFRSWSFMMERSF